MYETLVNLWVSVLRKRFSGHYALEKAQIESNTKILSDKIAAAQRIAESTNDNELKKRIVDRIFTL